MDDRSISPSTDYPVIRKCEANRFQKQLLARAYRQVFPEARRALGDAGVPAWPDRQGDDSSNSACRAAQGA